MNVQLQADERSATCMFLSTVGADAFPLRNVLRMPPICPTKFSHFFPPDRRDALFPTLTETTQVTTSKEFSSKGNLGSTLRSFTLYSSSCSFLLSSYSFIPSLRSRNGCVVPLTKKKGFPTAEVDVQLQAGREAITEERRRVGYFDCRQKFPLASQICLAGQLVTASHRPETVPAKRSIARDRHTSIIRVHASITSRTTTDWRSFQ